MRHIVKLVAALGAVFPSQAFAQSASDEIVINLPKDEIVVQGLYDQSKYIVNIPASVKTISDDDLSLVSLVHPAELLNSVAGVNIHRGSGQEHLTAIRSPVLTGGAGAGSFLYLEDGVPLRAAGFANVNGLFEAGTEFASTAEVFKGPGPVMFGSNAVHGLINVASVPVVPSKNYAQLMGSDDGLISAMTTVSGDNVRASASLVHDDGFRDDSGFDQQKFQVKYHGGIGDWTVDWLSSFNNLNQETAGFIQGDDAYKSEAVSRTNPNPEAFRDGKSYRTQARFERKIGLNNLAITPYARRAELRFLRHFVPGQALEKNGHSSVGFQSAYYSDDFNVGVDAEYTQGSLYEFQSNPNRFSFVQGLHYDYEVASFVAAAYAQKDIKLSANTVLDVGARAEYTQYDYDNNADTGRSGRFIRVGDRSDDFFVITPKLAIRHRLNDGGMVYARAARGARAPQVTDLYSVQLNQIAGEADVETLDSLEAGFKRDGSTWRFEVSAYTMWKDNFFFRNANGFNVVNGKTRHSGVEVSGFADLNDWLSVSGDVSLAKHTYDFTETVGSAANNITKGDRVDTAPDSLATLRVTAQPTQRSQLAVEWRHVGKYFTNPGNTQTYPGHDIFVLRGHMDVTNTAAVFARVDNLFDTRYADRADFAFGNERYFPGRPRTVFFGVRSDF